jgi:hypothetical protein
LSVAGVTPGLACSIASIVVPKFCAMPDSVSPKATVYVRVADWMGEGEAPGVGTNCAGLPCVGRECTAAGF